MDTLQRANNAEIVSLWRSNAQRIDVSNSMSECEAEDVFSYIKMISILYLALSNIILSKCRTI